MSPAASADHHNIPGDVLLFPDVSVFDRFNQGRTSIPRTSEAIPALNLFYSFDHDRLRLLVEWLVDSNSQEMQRLQVGWRWRDTTVWLGRIHNPVGYWNIRYHHGAYVTPTILRPGLVAFEGQGGPVPTHQTGLSVEGVQEFGSAGLYYVLAAGVGPDLTNRMLRAFDIFDPYGSYRPAVTLRLGYQPQSFGTDEIGLSLGYTEIPGDALGAHAVQQSTAGIFAAWQIDRVRLLGEAMYLHNRFDGAARRTEEPDVFNLYGQVEWLCAPKWTLYSRVEGTLNDNGDRYLQHFSRFVRGRYMGGVRWDLPYKMALKLELSEEQVRDDRFGQFAVQWSALFP